MEYLIDCNNKEEGKLKPVIERGECNLEAYYDMQIENAQADGPDIIELSDELGAMELKNFLYKR